jgi:hypothetical protein
MNFNQRRLRQALAKPARAAKWILISGTSGGAPPNVPENFDRFSKRKTQ